MARPSGPFIKGRMYKDDIGHSKHWAFLRQRAQANYRGEGGEFTIEEYFAFWPDDQWLCRGRAQQDLCMIRKDVERPWSKDNCVIIVRYQQLVRNKKPRKQPTNGFPKEL
jgi:hypothetical protein